MRVAVSFAVLATAAAVFLNSPLLSDAQEAKPSAGLRNFILGMPLADFRKLPMPESTNPSLGPETRTVKLYCKGDKFPKVTVNSFDLLNMSAEYERIGAIKCSHFYKPSSAPYPTWAINAMKVADADALVDFMFTPKDGPSGARLSMILARTGSDEFDGLERALIAKYGQPTTRDSSDAHNKLGGSFDNMVDVWDVGDASITLIKRDGHPNNTSLTYASKPLLAEIQSLLDERAKAAAGSL
jgi:hypothetical protein